MRIYPFQFQEVDDGSKPALSSPAPVVDRPLTELKQQKGRSRRAERIWPGATCQLDTDSVAAPSHPFFSHGLNDRGFEFLLLSSPLLSLSCCFVVS